MKKIMLYSLLVFAGLHARAQTPITIKQKSPTRHGTEKGSLIIIGGNVGSTASIWNKFTELAGGRDKAHIVVVTAAGGDSALYDLKSVAEVKKQTGIKDVILIHPKDLAEANSEKFIAPIKKATGVYFIGGRQWRIADAYLNTLAHQAFFDVLDRGGVIAGSSAGASIQGSLLWRGDTRGADILLGDHTQGLGLLKNSVIDQHVLKRNRQFDLVEVVRQTPELIGIGLDEATAVLVQRDSLEVIGRSYALIYDYNLIAGKELSAGTTDGASPKAASGSVPGPFFFLSEGQKYDLKNRKVIAPPKREQPEVPNSVN
ncbi:MAG TPA: cyanophycinase [Pedobacter sp.]